MTCVIEQMGSPNYLFTSHSLCLEGESVLSDERTPTCPQLAISLGSSIGLRTRASPRSASTHSPSSLRTRTLDDFRSLWRQQQCQQQQRQWWQHNNNNSTNCNHLQNSYIIHNSRNLKERFGSRISVNSSKHNPHVCVHDSVPGCLLATVMYKQL